MSNIVAIVGRPNVGKSTLFNRLVEQRKAIMHDESGVTRDRHYGYGEWIGKHFTVIDTGGYVTGSEDKFESGIRKQVEIAIEESSVILFMVDVEAGVTGLDKDFANVVRTSKKPVFLVANKSDNQERAFGASEFYALGLGDVFPVSAANGSGTGELLDAVVETFQDKGKEDPDAGIPKIAILGRPNVGKSSFLNTLLGHERSIVTDEAGTTRDAINSRYKLYGKDFILVDTAGLRKKSRVRENIEFYSVLRSLQALEESDVCVVVVDATQGLEAQDMNILGLAHRNNKGIMIMINKWDLVEKDSKTADQYKKAIQERLGELSYVPIIFTSVLEKQRIFQAIEMATTIYEDLNKKISTSKLNDVMLKEIEKYPPPAVRGRLMKIKYVTQIPGKSPAFAFFCNYPKQIKHSYSRYLENRIRDHFGFEGVPIRIYFRKK